jgi:hypothetical protein
MTHGAYDPDEDYNDAVSYTDPRGSSRFKHFAGPSHGYEPDVPEPHSYWWVAPIVFWGAAVILLLLFRTA